MAVDARSLAEMLGARSDDSLSALFAARSIGEAASWRDFFDGAEALLEPTSVRLGLSRLPHAAAAALAEAGTGSVSAQSETLADAALIDDTGTPFRIVGDIVASLPAPRAQRAAAPVPQPTDSAPAAERALTTVGSLADLLLLSYTRPLQQIGTGALGSTERRRLVDAGIVGAASDVDPLLAIASCAGLLRPVEREWLVTQAASAWLGASTTDRWRALAAHHRDALPSALSALTAAAWDDVYPWDPQWPETAQAWRQRATLLGMIDAEGAPTLWAGGDTASLQAHLPHEVDRVYLQNDLSAIAPGPLEPAADVRLRNAAVRESHAQASTYRFTEASVQNAIARGETEESLLSFLSEISLTGIPQPLAYLVRESARSHGAIIVGIDPESGRTVVTASGALRERLAVDQTLRPLAFVREGEALTSRIHRDTVALALADARYPVAVHDARGRPEPLQRGRIAPPEPQPEAHHGQLIARLRAADGGDKNAAWLERELDAAVRKKLVLEVTISHPDGERTLTLEAAGLGGGRLRGRDRGADVERTLPLSHITAVRVIS